MHPGLARLPATILPGQPPTALAPMQDVTDLPFMTAIGECGAPDWFFTEYFRVTETSRLERHILRSITENPTGRPVFAQLIGENLAALRRSVNELLKHPVAAIDLNMGCPAPKVYKKNVGGGWVPLVVEVLAVDQDRKVRLRLRKISEPNGALTLHDCAVTDGRVQERGQSVHC